MASINSMSAHLPKLFVSLNPPEHEYEGNEKIIGEILKDSQQQENFIKLYYWRDKIGRRDDVTGKLAIPNRILLHWIRNVDWAGKDVTPVQLFKGFVRYGLCCCVSDQDLEDAASILNSKTLAVEPKPFEYSDEYYALDFVSSSPEDEDEGANKEDRMEKNLAKIAELKLAKFKEAEESRGLTEEILAKYEHAIAVRGKLGPDQIQCFACGEVGHTELQCEKPENEQLLGFKRLAREIYNEHHKQDRDRARWQRLKRTREIAMLKKANWTDEQKSAHSRLRRDRKDRQKRRNAGENVPMLPSSFNQNKKVADH